MANSARIDELQRRFAENPRRYFAPLANEYRKIGNLEQAILICQEYLPQQPGHMSGHIVYGQTLYEAGRFAEARAVFETALALDPENLIALHHLGDIARELGDVETARTWYRRVLETDPRNEEILALLGELDTISVPAATDLETSTASPSPDEESSVPPSHVSPIPQFEPTSVPPIPTAPMSIPDEPLGFEPTAVEAVEASGSDLVEPLDAETTTAEGSAAPASDAASIDIMPVETAVEVPVEAAGARPSDEAQRTDGVVEPFEVAPQEQAQVEPTAAEEEIVAAESVGSPYDTAPGSSMLDAELFGEFDDVAATVQQSAAVDLSAVDLSAAAPTESTADIEREVDIFEAPASPAETSVFANEDTLAATLMTPTSADEAVRPPDEAVRSEASALVPETPPENAPIDGGHEGEEVPAAPSEMFVTETMADLYLRQGHLESALDIFRQLATQRPADERLRERLRSVENLLFGATVEIEAPAPPTSPSSSVPVEAAGPAPTEEMVEPERVPARPTSPTIREFLTGILARRVAEPQAPTTAAAEAAPPADAPGPPEEALPAASARSDEGKGPVDSLFPDTTPSEASVTAATVLADAFADSQDEAPPLDGIPAHRAADELSLDHVFRSTTPAKASLSAEAFSFDRFFAEEGTKQTPPTPEAPDNPTDSVDDIAQFNAWLSGLKKT